MQEYLRTAGACQHHDESHYGCKGNYNFIITQITYHNPNLCNLVDLYFLARQKSVKIINTYNVTNVNLVVYYCVTGQAKPQVCVPKFYITG